MFEQGLMSYHSISYLQLLELSLTSYSLLLMLTRMFEDLSQLVLYTVGMVNLTGIKLGDLPD